MALNPRRHESDAPLIAERYGPVLHLRLNNPRRHNALQNATLAAFEGVFRDLGDDVRTVVLDGNGRQFLLRGWIFPNTANEPRSAPWTSAALGIGRWI